MKEEATDVTRKGRDRNPYLSLCPLFSNFCTIAQDQPNPSGILKVREATHHQPLRSASRGGNSRKNLCPNVFYTVLPHRNVYVVWQFSLPTICTSAGSSSLLQQHWSPLSPCGDLLCQFFPSPEL